MKPRVVIVDDSTAMRGVMRALLCDEGRVDVVGEASNGDDAVERVRELAPDVVTMDVLMPGLDGISCVEQIMAEAPTRVLVVSSAVETEGAALSIRAVAAGALEVIAKPASNAGPIDVRRWGRSLAESIALMAEVPVITRRTGSHPRLRPPAPSAHAHARPGQFVDVIAIAASTGGPPALASLLSALCKMAPQSRAPIVVAQHLAEGFSAGMARWLGEATRMRVVVAAPSMRAEPGCAYIAPDGRDVVVAAATPASGLVLDTPPPEGAHRPSADRLLTSVAAMCGGSAAGVVLTGMGDDGAVGLRALRERGAATFAQTPSSCVVAGMPSAAIALGAATDVLDIDAIAAALAPLVRAV